MKKFTAGILGVVMGGGILIEPVHAEIASKLYVDGKFGETTTSLNNKQDVSNLVDSAGYSNAANADDKYPSVKAVHDAIQAETTSRTQETQDLEQRIQDHADKLITSQDYQSELEIDEEHYPSAKAVQDAIQSATSELETQLDVSSKQDKSNLVKDSDFAEENDAEETKYPSVKAVKGAITTATNELDSQFDTQLQTVESSITNVSKQVQSVQDGLDLKVPLPSEDCKNGTNKCVLTVDGSHGYTWEIIERASGEIVGE